jgi:hypothetical protein
LDRDFEKRYLKIRKLPEGNWVDIWEECNLSINADPRTLTLRRQEG